MDVFYEESSINRNERSGKTKYKIFHILANVFLAIAILCVCFTFYVPLDGLLLWLFICAWFFGCWFILFKLKNRFNVNYDYTFVSGELRIVKVFNVNKRKLLVRIQPDDIIQLGDVDNASFDVLRTDPNTKLVLCTANDEPSADKFLMYILANVNGKTLYVLECREVLLMHMLRFVKRTTLESDYVSQEKKTKNI